MPHDPNDLAIVLLQEIREALAKGTKHYNEAGKLLTTELEIIECMLAEGGVRFEPAPEEE